MNIFSWFREDKALSFAILRILKDQLGGIITYMPPSEEDLDREQLKLDCLTQWAKTLEQPYRRTYLYWLDYFQRQTVAARRELRTRAQTREQAREQELLAAAKRRSVPKPPLC